MATQWFYAHGGDRKGPFSPDEMRALALAGTIVRTDTVWQQGVERGAPAAKIRHLFPAAAVIVVAPTLPAPVAVEPAPEAAPAVVIVPPERPQEPRKRRAVAVRGATVVGQDGEHVRFRKKCTACGHEDSARATSKIIPGQMKSAYYCPKCKKSREVILQGFQG